jgi:peptidoglycan/LPS O-acetylase OafA/YrhL
LIGCLWWNGGLLSPNLWLTFWIGAPRAAFSFFAGVAIYQVDRAPAVRLPIFITAAVLTLTLFMPIHSAIFEAVAVFLIFPAAIWFGAAADSERLKRPCLFLGATSYGIYALHWPLLAIAVKIAERL